MKLPIPVFSLLLLSSFAPAAEQAGTHTLSEFSIGRTISGSEVKLSELKGKAVFIDAWGTHCPPCLALIPEVQKLSQKYKDKLVVVGAESQGSPDGSVKAIVQEKKMTYTVTQGVTSPVHFSMLPFGFVFDSNGAMVFAGRPEGPEFEKAIHKAVHGVNASGAEVSGLDALKALQRK
jgi:thiol-disulfide isomerase/thioredoxin